MNLPSPVQLLELNETRGTGVRLWIKRDDLIHPEVGGNKWRKLNTNLKQAIASGKKKLLTFGGRHSNHLSATASMGQLYGMPTIGIVRGEAPAAYNEAPTLQAALQKGMHLHFISRSEYRMKHHPSRINSWLRQFGPDCYLIPEGGSNLAGVQGCRTIASEVRQQCPDIQQAVWCVPCGTGATLAGIASELDPLSKIIGFAVLKGNFLENDIRNLVPETLSNWQINHDFHFGGYASYSQQLVEFIQDFRLQTGIQLDPIYTGKMMYGMVKLISKSAFQPGTDLIAVHTGGLQGIAAYETRYGVQL